MRPPTALAFQVDLTLIEDIWLALCLSQSADAVGRFLGQEGMYWEAPWGIDGGVCSTPPHSDSAWVGPDPTLFGPLLAGVIDRWLARCAQREGYLPRPRVEGIVSMQEAADRFIQEMADRCPLPMLEKANTAALEIPEVLPAPLSGIALAGMWPDPKTMRAALLTAAGRFLIAGCRARRMREREVGLE